MKRAEIKIDKYVVYIYFEDHEIKYFTEARDRGIKLVGIYSYFKNKPHNKNGEDHLHVLKKGKQIFAINRSGSAHDRSHGVSIPRKVADALRKEFPDWEIPKNNIIESFEDRELKLKYLVTKILID